MNITEAKEHIQKVINKEIESLETRLAEQLAKSAVFIASLPERNRAYRAIDNLEVQIKTLVRIEAALLANIQKEAVMEHSPHRRVPEIRQ